MVACCVFQEWMFELPMQQQSVLVLACREPDGIGKYHPTKPIVRHYRASVLKNASLGRAMRLGEAGRDTFQTLHGFGDDTTWGLLVDKYFENADNLPHHFNMHLIHGAEILAYKHPDRLFRNRWSYFYKAACDDLHLNVETEQEMDYRLGDWNRVGWEG